MQKLQVNDGSPKKKTAQPGGTVSNPENHIRTEHEEIINDRSPKKNAQLQGGEA